MKNNYSKFLLEFSLSIKKSVKFNYYVLAMLFALSISFTSNGQAIIRYQNEIKGGTTKTGNTFDSGATSGTSGFPTHSHTLLDLDADATTIRSTSADLVLPANSTIVKAYLYLETSGPFFLNDFKFKVPGQTNYSVIPLTDALSNSGTSYNQVVFDVTKYITSPTTMYSTSSAGGTGGRYWVADVKNNTNGTYSHSYGGGWTLQIVYSNPNSKYRHVALADYWHTYGGGGGNTASYTATFPSVKVPLSSSANAVVGVSGLWGNRNSYYTSYPVGDLVSFGKTGTSLTNLIDPLENIATDVMNSSIAFTSNNNVSADGGPAMSGNYLARNPAQGYTDFYDSDILNANGILPTTASPISVDLRLTSTSNDIFMQEAYLYLLILKVQCLKKLYRQQLLLMVTQQHIHLLLQTLQPQVKLFRV